MATLHQESPDFSRGEVQISIEPVIPIYGGSATFVGNLFGVHVVEDARVPPNRMEMVSENWSVAVAELTGEGWVVRGLPAGRA